MQNVTVLGHCIGCSWPMISRKAWIATPDQRADYAAHAAFSQCTLCYPRARSDARQDMNAVQFASMSSMCKHTNGVHERRVLSDDFVPVHRRWLKKECRDCGLHLGYFEPDNPALPTRQELAARQASPPDITPRTWGRRHYEWRWHPVLQRSVRIEVPPTECPQGHPLELDTLLSHTYTCPTCDEDDPYVARWQPATAQDRPSRSTRAHGITMGQWRDGSIHVNHDNWSNMAIPHHVRHRDTELITEIAALIMSANAPREAIRVPVDLQAVIRSKGKPLWRLRRWARFRLNAHPEDSGVAHIDRAAMPELAAALGIAEPVLLKYLARFAPDLAPARSRPDWARHRTEEATITKDSVMALESVVGEIPNSRAMMHAPTM